MVNKSTGRLISFFDNRFVDRFVDRRDSDDSVNRFVDDPQILKFLGEVKGKRLLEIGCGLGDLCWHLQQKGALVQGVEISSAMIDRALNRHPSLKECIRLSRIEEIPTSPAYELIVSSLVVHFVKDIDKFFSDVFARLVGGGVFVFSQRHPIRTSETSPGEAPEKHGWPVKNYFDESRRDFKWLGGDAFNYHRPLSTIFSSLRNAGFDILDIAEPVPVPEAKISARTKECWHVPPIITMKCERK